MLAPGRKALSNLGRIFKSRDITLPTKVSSSHVWMWDVEYKESWMPMNWCFWTMVLEKTPWTERRSNQSILKGISPECSLERLMLKLKLQYFGHLMWRTDSLEKTLILGKIEGKRKGDDRGWGGWMTSPIWWTWVWASSRSWWWTGKPTMLQALVLKELGTTEQLNRTEFLEIEKRNKAKPSTHTNSK